MEIKETPSQRRKRKRREQRNNARFYHRFWLTVEEIAEREGRSPSWVRRHAHDFAGQKVDNRDDLGGARPGKTWRFPQR